MTADQVRFADATLGPSISDDDAQAFLEDGLLVIRNVLGESELALLRAETLALVLRSARREPNDPYVGDFVYSDQGSPPRSTPSRVEYIIDKSAACRALLGHPFILRTVEKLMGPSFIPTWDSMVFKFEGLGAPVPWHRDAGPEWVKDAPIFNVDFYLDEANIENCLWAIPGSNRWSEAQIARKLAELNEGGFQTDGALPVLMRPGDVILHNILTLHGSPLSRTKLRRVIYYEFRSIETELAKGPHVPAYVPVKQNVLLSCLRQRTACSYARDEIPFIYRPAGQKAPTEVGELATYRYAHEAYWLEGQTASWAK